MRLHDSKGRVSGACVVFLVAVCAASGATIGSITVAGSANPYLAGMPDGSTCCSGDSAPAQSPVQVLGLSLTPGTMLTFSVTGSVSFAGGAPTDPPDGGGFFGGTASNNGIAGMNAPVDALVGVFLDSTQPSLSAAPASLDFSAAGGLTFATLSPGLKQVFFIGDGLTGNGSGSVQQFTIPTGTTRLFLGTVDGFGWFNNSGSFSVSVTGDGPSGVPEPGSIFLVGSALVSVVLMRRRLSVWVR